MAGLASLSRAAVLDAIADCDRLGVAAFLDGSGYRPSKAWQLRHRGRSYPSKAIVGVAAGLAPSELFGGVAQTVPALARLGFKVRQGRRFAPADELVDLAAAFAQPDRETPLDHVPAAYFASGSNRPGEIRGLARVGHDVGVAVPELAESSLVALEKLGGTDVQVFVDSGAFSEVAFGPDGPTVVRPMDAAAWRRVFEVYARLARALGPQLWVVAPDRIGDQDETLRRLAAYRRELADLAELGVRVLVPVQKGARSQAAFAEAIDETLGFAWLPALPCKKAASSADDVAAFVAARAPTHVHLLGLGIRNARVADYLAAASSCSVSLDSNWIAANVGRQGKVRPYTAARDIARRLVGEAARVAEIAIVIALGLRGV